MDCQLHAQSDKNIISNNLFKLFSSVELLYQMNKIALIAASIWSMIKAFALLVQF